MVTTMASTPPASSDSTPAANPDTYTVLRSNITTVEEGFYNWYSWQLNNGTELLVTVAVLDGGPVDIMLMDTEDWPDFQSVMAGGNGTFTYYVAGSRLDTFAHIYNFTTPVSDTFYLVVNNAGQIEGGAEPSGDASVYISVVAKTAAPSGP